MNDPLVIESIYCVNHPNVETGLRCKRCNKPICAKCARSTPTGYICKECEGQQQKTFETAIQRDYFLAVIISGVLSMLGSAISLSLGFFVLLLSPIAGMVIAESVRSAIQKRRSERLFRLVAAACVLGALPLTFATFFSGNIISILVQVFFIVTTAATAYQRLRGFQL